MLQSSEALSLFPCEQARKAARKRCETFLKLECWIYKIRKEFFRMCRKKIWVKKNVSPKKF